MPCKKFMISITDMIYDCSLSYLSRSNGINYRQVIGRYQRGFGGSQNSAEGSKPAGDFW